MGVGAVDQLHVHKVAEEDLIGLGDAQHALHVFFTFN